MRNLAAGVLVLLAVGCSSASSSSPPPPLTTTGSEVPAPIEEPPPLPTTTGTPPPEGAPAIGFVGRFDTREAAGPWCSWSGCRIVARFSGTSVSAKLEEEYFDGQEGPSEWDVTIDGVLQPHLTMILGVNDYALATGLTDGIHTIELYKRTEAQDGRTRFLGFDLGGGKLLAPPKASTRRIEIVGDSTPAGFGVEGVGPDCPGADWAARYQNFHKSFGAQLGAKFSADVHGTVYSGKGLTQNVWRPDTDVMPVLFGRTNPLDPTSTFDLSSWQPDVVIMMIGGNDFAIGSPDDNGPPSYDTFLSAYDGFVGTLRGAYPNAHVFLAVSPSLSDENPADRGTRSNVRAAIESVIVGRNDARLHSAEPAPASPDEVTGCAGHANAGLHTRIATELAPLIQAETGWK